MQRLAHHQTPMQHKHKCHGVEFQCGTLHPHPKRYLRHCPALVHPEGHDLHVDERHGDGRAFEVVALASRVFWNHGDGHVEARESGEAAQDEEGEEQMVDRGAEAE
jgi:hypothetical protein